MCRHRFYAEGEHIVGGKKGSRDNLSGVYAQARRERNRVGSGTGGVPSPVLIRTIVGGVIILVATAIITYVRIMASRAP